MFIHIEYKNESGTPHPFIGGQNPLRVLIGEDKNPFFVLIREDKTPFTFRQGRTKPPNMGGHNPLFP